MSGLMITTNYNPYALEYVQRNKLFANNRK